MTPDLLPPKMVAKVAVSESGCWEWTGARQTFGYAITTIDRRVKYAHRLSYEALVGPIPQGLQIDHLCRVRHCINPEHLEAVTPQENLRRALPFRTTAQRTT